ncbi:MAG: HAD family hydrolase [Clostridia bacterium]|nr:HAD family hydrolase [Clostridia bacterium]
MYKAIFVDIDGTLRDDNRNISQRTKDVIKKISENGTYVVITSGRPKKYTENISRMCNASKYIISSGGASIDDYEGNLNLKRDVISKKTCEKIYKMAQELGIRVVMNMGEKRYANRLVGKKDELLIENLDELLKNSLPEQCVILDENYEKIKEIREKVLLMTDVVINNQHKCFTNPDVPKNGIIYIDITNSTISKGKAIKSFCKYLNIDLKDTLSIGDEYNDISMFETTGKSMAMGNAPDAVKQKASFVGLTNNEDGVAVYLENI